MCAFFLNDLVVSNLSLDSQTVLGFLYSALVTLQIGKSAEFGGGEESCVVCVLWAATSQSVPTAHLPQNCGLCGPFSVNYFSATCLEKTLDEKWCQGQHVLSPMRSGTLGIAVVLSPYSCLGEAGSKTALVWLK